VTALMLFVSTAYGQIIGKSPYPMIFVHGINSSDANAWYDIIDDDVNPDLQDVYGDFNSFAVYHAVLNASSTSTKLEDDVVYNYNGINDALSSSGSLFTINFETSIDGNGNLLLYNASNGIGQSAGNESGEVKGPWDLLQAKKLNSLQIFNLVK